MFPTTASDSGSSPLWYRVVVPARPEGRLAVTVIELEPELATVVPLPGAEPVAAPPPAAPTRPDPLLGLTGRQKAAVLVLQLSRTEYKLLHTLAQNVGRVMTHELLLERVWGAEYNREVDFIWVYISRLRRKIEADPRHPRYILTIPDVGYKLAKL